jgi:hypothetical protein
MINWKLEVDGIACPVNNMNAKDCTCSFVRRGEVEGRENKGGRYKLIALCIYHQQRAHPSRWRKGVSVPRDAWY